MQEYMEWSEINNQF